MYSKGDWRVEEPANEGVQARTIMGEDRKLISGLVVGGEVIATVNDKANAPVICQAPKLYEALKALVLNEKECGIPEGQSVIRARQAIASVEEK